MLLSAVLLAALAAAFAFPCGRPHPPELGGLAGPRGPVGQDPEAADRSPAAPETPRSGAWSRVGGRARILVVAAPGAVAFALLDGVLLMLTLVLLAAAGQVGRIALRARARAAADRRAATVVELCEVLVGELRAGLPPLTALEACVRVWPEFQAVATSARLGADVPSALRRLSTLPGAAGLRDVGAAWQVAEGSGSALSVALGQVAGSVREAQATHRLVRSELASAQATARIVALLPVATLAMGAGAGGDPWGFLLGTPAGVGCLALGLTLAFTGLGWIDRIAAAVEER